MKEKTKNKAKQLGIAGTGLLVGMGPPIRFPLNLGINTTGKITTGKPLRGAKSTYEKLLRHADVRGKPTLIISSRTTPHYFPKLPDAYIASKNYGKKTILGIPWNKFKKEHIGLPPKANAFVIAHELGHASGGIGKKLLSLARVPFIGKVPIPLGPLAHVGGLGLLTHAALTGRKGEDKPKTLYLAPAVAAYSPVVTQLEELRATLKATKILRNAKVHVPNLGRKLLAQQSNYLLGGMRSLAPIIAGSLLLSSYLNQKKP